VVILLAGRVLWVSGAPPASPQSAGSSEPGVGDQLAVLVGAGDIAGCQNLQGALETAKLIEKIPGTVFALGDLAYDAVTLGQFQNCYGRAWGKFKARTRPTLGNHEYRERSAAPYYQYWAEQAGPSGKGYYSYELGAWHVVVLNTNCDAVGLVAVRPGRRKMVGCAKTWPIIVGPALSRTDTMRFSVAGFSGAMRCIRN